MARLLQSKELIPHKQSDFLSKSINSNRADCQVALTILNQYFPPDFAATGQLIEELAVYLSQQKISVQVFTGQPSYAFNQANAPAREMKENVLIHRTRVSKTRKLLGRTGSGLLYCARAIFHLLKSSHRGDLLLLTSEPPFLFIVGYLVHRLFKTGYVCLIYDLYPDAVVEFGVANKKSTVVRFWNWVNRSVWGRAEAIIVLSETMRERVLLNAPHIADKISIIHNWSDPNWIKPIPKAENPFAAEHQLQDKFVVMYSGNMGRCHDLETVMAAAEILRDEPILFVFIGAGPKRKECEDRAHLSHLQNCIFLPYQDKEVLPYSLTACDLSLVSVGEGMEGVVAPSKFYSALAAGRPIAAICESHSYLRQLIADANCGTAFLPGDSQGLAAFIRYLTKDPQRQNTMGQMGSTYIQNRFTPEGIGKQYLQLVEQAVLKDSELIRALKFDEFKLFYEPVYSLRSGQLSGLELLVYWQHPQKGLLSPEEFIPFADKTGLLIEMGEQWIPKALEQLSEFQSKWQLPLLLKINLSAKQFFHPRLVPNLDQYIEKFSIDPAQLSLDIAEETLMCDGAAATSLLLQLQQRKIKVCLENFGEGATSVKFLNRFPLKMVEIDRKVVDRLEFDPEANSLIESIVLLTEGIELDVIAEGIQSEKQLNRLKALGVGQGKGYLFSKPISAETVISDILVTSQGLSAAAPLGIYGPEEKLAAGQKPLILVIDDDRAMRRLLKMAITKEGFQVIEASSGTEGVFLAKQEKPVLILLDGMMDDINGFECCRQIRLSEQEAGDMPVPILMITALEDSSSISTAYDLGITDYITKPVNWELLRQRIRRFLSVSV